MSNQTGKRRLVGPWRNLHGAVWLIGLAILAWQGWWWPGILVLVAISLLLEGALMQFAPQAFVDEPAASASPQPPAPVATPAPAAPPEQRLELLPATCPNCGGPLHGKDVKWTGPQSADCPYCGANLPMRASPVGTSQN
jgi:hypothetical protein